MLEIITAVEFNTEILGRILLFFFFFFFISISFALPDQHVALSRVLPIQQIYFMNEHLEEINFSYLTGNFKHYASTVLYCL
jgi:hypothetical protein